MRKFCRTRSKRSSFCLPRLRGVPRVARSKNSPDSRLPRSSDADARNAFFSRNLRPPIFPYFDMKNVAVIDYGMGNLMSVLRAWQRVGANARIISAPAEIADGDILVFPGQGCIVDTIKLLKSTGFDDAIRGWIAADKPFFGICLGLQALFEYSEEGDVECLGIFRGRVKKLRLDRKFKVPHMGWDNIAFKRAGNEKLLDGISDADQFYFVHSYFVDTPQTEIVLGTTEYGGQAFTSAIARGNLVATQFHPEKSQSKGLQLYANFLANAR